MNNWAIQSVVLPFLFPLMLCDIHKVLDNEDQAYFREQREKQLGKKLEEARPERSNVNHNGLLHLQTQRVLRPPTRAAAQAQCEPGITAHTGRSLLKVLGHGMQAA